MMEVFWAELQVGDAVLDAIFRVDRLAVTNELDCHLS